MVIEKEEIRHILTRIRGKKILVIGDIIVDEYIFGNAYRLSREAPIPIIRFISSEIRPGGAGNVAMNIASMGGSATLIGVLGKDVYAKELLNIFAKAKIETGYILSDDAQTVTKTRVLAGDINTSPQQILRLDRGIQNSYRPRIYKRLEEIISVNIDKYDAICISDYGEGLFNDGLIRQIRRISKGVKVLVDSRFNFIKFRGCLALTPNINEISQIYGRYTKSREEIISAAKKIKKITGSRYILIKQGSSGLSLLKENQRLISFAPFGNTEVADVTGAGDTVLAAFSLALSANISVTKAAGFANITGGIKVQKRGTSPVVVDDIIKAINGKKI